MLRFPKSIYRRLIRTIELHNAGRLATTNILLATSNLGRYDRGTLFDFIREKTAIPWQVRADEGLSTIIPAGYRGSSTWFGVG